MALNYQYNDQLESERLVTRFITMDDVCWWQEFFEDKQAIEFLGLPEDAGSLEKSRAWAKRQMQRHKDKTYGLQVLVDKQSGNPIGQCGLLQQEILGKNQIEVGYHILPRYWGNGFAPEAAKLFISFAFKHKVAPSIVSLIHKENLRSQRVAVKNGMKVDAEILWHGMPSFVFRVNEKDWGLVH